MGKIETIPFEQEQPEVKQCVESYWSKRAEGFFELREAEIESNKYGRWEAEILEHLPKDKTLKILDVGCGCGFFGIILFRHGHDVTGIDLTPEMIEKGRELAVEYSCKVDLQVMDAENLGFADETFDVIISRNLTWTLPHPQEAYQEWVRVLKPGGMLLNYDAEYARDHHHHDLPEDHAHNDIDVQLKEECHKIYHMLSISDLSRPDWDMAVLEQIGMQIEPVDTHISEKIYKERDRFYVPNKVFRIKAFK